MGVFKETSAGVQHMFEPKQAVIKPDQNGKYIFRNPVIPPFLIELMGRKSEGLLLFKNRWTTIC